MSNTERRRRYCNHPGVFKADHKRRQRRREGIKKGEKVETGPKAKKLVWRTNVIKLQKGTTGQPKEKRVTRANPFMETRSGMGVGGPPKRLRLAKPETAMGAEGGGANPGISCLGGGEGSLQGSVKRRGTNRAMRKKRTAKERSENVNHRSNQNSKKKRKEKTVGSSVHKLLKGPKKGSHLPSQEKRGPVRLRPIKKNEPT